MSLKTAVRSRVFASIPLKTLFWLLNNYAMLARARLGRAHSSSGSSHAARPVDDSLAYLEHVFAEYKRYARIERFAGDVVELGPGDNAGVAMLMRGDGAERVELVDRYYSERDPDEQAAIYAALARRHGLAYLSAGEHWREDALEGITWRTDRSAEDFLRDAADAGRRFDAIVSRAVLEHVMDPLHVIEHGSRCLAPGGVMVHVVDLRDHGYYSREHDELTYLSVPRTAWVGMTRGCGGPNRILVHRYRERLEAVSERHELTWDIRVQSLAGVGEIDPYVPFAEIDAERRERSLRFVAERRSRFAGEFRDVADEDLAISGFCLIVRAAPDM